jgi:signal transduction histidine kinase
MDGEAFDAVVTHLLDNAVEAAGESGVSISLRRESLSMIVDITDTGPGMTPEFIRDELFTPLRSTKRGGHGIGVFQARELLRDAGGDLFAISRIGAGTTMRLILPLAGVPASAVETA